MRTKATNFLQVVVLLTGIAYIALGLTFFVSPPYYASLFSVELTDDWFKGIMLDPYITSLFFMARGFAAMVFSIGASMILPLYDPLKYRGLVYFTGILFPVMAASLLIYNGIKLDYYILSLTGLFFLFIFLLTSAGLIITNKDAKAGVE